MVVNKRITKQKIKILEYLHSVTSHPSAETVYNSIKMDIPSISLATVYRNLNQMSTDGTILKLEVNGEFRFDGNVENHIHIVDEDGIIYDEFDTKIFNQIKQNQKMSNYDIKNIKIIIKGNKKDTLMKN